MNLRSCNVTLKRVKRRAHRAWLKLTIFSRSLILLIIKSLFASFVLGELTPVATAYYAMTFGFRVPIEGVPYVSAAMATLAFLGFLLTGACMFSFVVTLRHTNFIVKFTNYLIAKLAWLPSGLTVPLESVLSRRQTWAVLILSVTVVTLLELLIFYHFNLNVGSNYVILFLILIFVNLLAMISLAVISNLTSFFQFQIWLSAAVIVASATCLFNTGLYGSFLRVIRYGGGIEYEVIVAKGSTPTMVKGYLLIQNDQMVIMMSEDKSRIIEIPVRLIESRSASLSPLWQLPDSKISSQSRYLVFP
ncbi:hypothetical protein G6L86_09370 [Agrobacterium tumefaciens]|uniref:hypothetical protein n=1 Tax=Agrobacterium tumefaciens TaxID=358 RepID=UPI0015729AE5|nr:hypothetical protein [Agrobacterium tumefaciens]NSX85793.1 hypothetical protein [Agrobacterium tumefaciens]